VVNYSLIAYAPVEGYRIEFEGTRGRIIHTNVERPWVYADGNLPPEVDERNDIVVQPLFPETACASRCRPARACTAVATT
jgi:hypothetical protein